MSPVARPPRTDAHRERDRLIAQFAALGLTPVISTNGSIPSADIQVSYEHVPGGGGIVRADLTQRGARRLEVVLMPANREPFGVRIENA